MMKEEMQKIRICPLCGCSYTGHPALSRTDGETLICPDCGTRQALDSIGIGEAEQEEILRIIHRVGRGNDE